MNLKIVIIGIAFLFLSSCGDDRPVLTKIQLESRLEVQAGLGSLVTHFFILNNENTQAQLFLQNLDQSQISEILPSECRISAGSGLANYETLREITIHASSISNPSFKREIFYQDFIPINHDGDLQLFGSLSDVKEIFTDNLYNLEVRLKFKSFNPSTMDNRIFMTFNVYGTE